MPATQTTQLLNGDQQDGGDTQLEASDGMLIIHMYNDTHGHSDTHTVITLVVQCTTISL